MRLAIATGHDMSVALIDGERVVDCRRTAGGFGMAEAVMPAIRGLLGDGQTRPDSILVETGPGSFTGLRIGIAIARALGFAWEVPVHGVRSTLLVAAVMNDGAKRWPLLVGLTAPRGQIWAEGFADATLRSAMAPVAMDAVAFDRLCADWPLVGGTVPQADPVTAPFAGQAGQVPDALLTEPSPLYVRMSDGA